jgi:hypothetical protein
MTNRYQAVDPILTDVSLGYKNAAYIADLLLPTLPMKLQSGKHFVYDKGMFRSEDNKRGPGARSKEVTHNISTGLTYFCEDHALKEFVADEDVDGAPEGVDPYVDATEFVTEKHLVAKEIEAATLLTSTGTITQNETLSGTSQWSDPNSDPVAAVRDAKATVRDSIMIDPNSLMLSKKVFDKLVDHPAIVERVKYSQLGVLSADLLARFFDVERVIIGAAKKNTSVEGQADSMSDIWGRDALLAYINPRLGQKTVSLGVTYQWKQRSTERLNGTDERDRRGQFIRVGDHYYDQELIAAGAAYLFKDAVAA